MKTQPKILVIDDEQVICESFKRIFANQGYLVDTMKSPLEGLNVVTSDQYNLVFLDLKMDEMDGIELFHKIREKEPDLPVVVVTGYPSVATATEAIRLHASDYLLKPFTPDEILQVTRKITMESRHPDKDVKEKLSQPQALPEWRPAGKPVMFYETAWLQQGKDGTFRVGGQLPAFITRFTTDLTLPAVNDTLYQGLPMASATIIDQSFVIIPSPVTGKIIDVNHDLAANPSLIERNSIRDCWIARIAPSDADKDLSKTQTRRIVMLSKGADETGEFRKKLVSMGYIVNSTDSVISAKKTLKKDKDKVVFINASAYSDEGYSLVQSLNEEVPDVNMVIIGNPDSQSEEALRKNKILYYCIRTLFNKEITDILYSTYIARKRDTDTGGPVSPGVIKQSISKISTVDKRDRKVSLLIFGDLLTSHTGIGSILLDKFVKNSCLFEVSNGINNFSPDDATGRKLIKEEKENYDQIITLQVRDMEKIPGQVRKDLEIHANEKGSKMTLVHITVQANKIEKFSKMFFNNKTTKAIAELLFDEMTSFNSGK